MASDLLPAFKKLERKVEKLEKQVELKQDINVDLQIEVNACRHLLVRFAEGVSTFEKTGDKTEVQKVVRELKILDII